LWCWLYPLLQIPPQRIGGCSFYTCSSVAGAADAAAATVYARAPLAQMPLPPTTRIGGQMCCTSHVPGLNQRNPAFLLHSLESALESQSRGSLSNLGTGSSAWSSDFANISNTSTAISGRFWHKRSSIASKKCCFPSLPICALTHGIKIPMRAFARSAEGLADLSSVCHNCLGCDVQRQKLHLLLHCISIGILGLLDPLQDGTKPIPD